MTNTTRSVKEPLAPALRARDATSRLPHDAPMQTLPEALQRAIRVAPASPQLRAIFRHVRRPIRLDAEIPGGDDALPLTARQLLKVASLGGPLSLDSVKLVADAGALRLAFSVDGRTFAPEIGELEGDVNGVAMSLLEELLSPEDLTHAITAFAAHSAKLDALQAIARPMLLATSVDEALSIMLLGITSGFGLGMNRAAVFVREGGSAAFAGSKAIGPYDALDAHRIWDAIEDDEKSLDELVRDAVTRNVDSRFETAIRALALAPSDTPGDEVTTVLASERPCRFDGRAPVSATLVALAPGQELVLAPIRVRGEVRGLVFADNLFVGNKVDDDLLMLIGSFVDQLALVWENLALLQRVETLRNGNGNGTKP